MHMPVSIDAIEAEILVLPASERARLLDKLIESLDIDPTVEAAWQREAQRRDDEIESGEVEALSGNAVVAQLRAGLR